MNKYIITNGKIILPDRISSGDCVVLENGKIVDISSNSDIYKNYEKIDAEGNYISPGFVELHIHGCSKIGFEEHHEDTLADAASFLSDRGINTFVPTIQCNETVLKNLVDVLDRGKYSERIPGIYIEGPFVNMKERGGILPKHVKEPCNGHLDKIISMARGHLKLMTVAPEIRGAAEIINSLSINGIIPCLGHSDADLHHLPELITEKLNITHLFNAMSPISHKKAGLAMLPFMDDDVYFELNSDLIHVSKQMVSMCYNYLNKDRLILITDAVVSAGAEYGRYSYFGKQVESNSSGVRYRDNGILIGSNCLIPEVAKKFMRVTEASVHEVVRFISTNPCRLLGIDDRKGSIEIGKDADLVIMDEEFNVKKNLAEW